MGDGHLRKGEGLHAGGEAGGSLRAVKDVLRGEGRQAASEEGAVLLVERVGAAAAVVVEEGLPVGRVGAAAAVGCSFCRTCDVIYTSPPTRDRKTEEQSNSGAIIPLPQQGTEKQRSNIFVEEKRKKPHGIGPRETTDSEAGCSDKKADEKQSPFLLSQRKEESSQLILKEEK